MNLLSVERNTVNNSEDKDSVLSEVARLKKTRDFAGLARALLSVNTDGLWRGHGYKSFGKWGERTVERKRATVYLYVEIAKYLSELSEEQMNRLGVGKCKYLMYLAKYFGTLDSDWVQKAAKLDFPTFKREVERELRKDSSSEVFGERFDFRGMVHAPVNEQGVVYLFGMVSRELGFLVEAVNRAYPDCTAKRQFSVRPERWKTVRIEFEYKSSAFNHPPEGSDLIVCWEDDLAERGVKAPLPVLELKSSIRDLSRTLP